MVQYLLAVISRPEKRRTSSTEVLDVIASCTDALFLTISSVDGRSVKDSDHGWWHEKEV